jgi:dihydropteroate synthase
MSFMGRTAGGDTDKIQDLDCGTRVLKLSTRTHIMGILNVTPDSFYDGGRYFHTDQAVEQGLLMARQGADIIDVGGESTRPGSDPVPADEEAGRVIPVIAGLRRETDTPISIDTRKEAVAREALNAGACLVNDVSGLNHDPEMAHTAAKAGVPVVVMHMRGTPKTMQKDTAYDDLLNEVLESLRRSVETACEAGISRDKIVIDPGIGFGKRWEHNFTILKNLSLFLTLDCPLLVGVSRKSFIGYALELPESERLMGTAAAVAASIMGGAHIIRVHDVAEMSQVARIIDRIRAASN